MSNSTISALASGSPAQATDVLPAARSGANVKLAVSDITALTVAKTPGVDQTINDHSLLPASGNTTQSLGSTAAPWEAILNDVTLKTLNNVLVANQFPGSDIGAKINAAYAALPASGGVILVFPQSSGVAFSFSTPIVFNTAGKYVRLQGFGTSGSAASALTGTVLNYTPTTATTAVTLDYYSSTFTNPPNGHGLRDITIVNNQSTATGGSGSLATGILIGSSNNGSETPLFDNVNVYGFGIGYQNVSISSYGAMWRNPCFQGNTIAIKHGTSQIFIDGGSFFGNGQAFVAVSSTTPEAYFTGVDIVNNTVGGPAFDFTAVSSPGNLFLVNCHLENSPGQNAHHISGLVNVSMQGGLMEDDTSTGTGDWMVSATGNCVISVDGTTINSARAYTNVFTFAAGSRGNLAATNQAGAITSSMFVGGVNAAFVTSRIVPIGSGTAPYTWTFESPLAMPSLKINGGASLSNYIEGTWTPVATGITTTGTVTYSGSYTQIGRLVRFTITVTHAAASTSAATAGASITLPKSAARDAAAIIANNGNNYTGSGQIHVGSVFVTSWTTTTGAASSLIYISGSYEVS